MAILLVASGPATLRVPINLREFLVRQGGGAPIELRYAAGNEALRKKNREVMEFLELVTPKAAAQGVRNMLPFSKFTGKLKIIGLVGGILVVAGLGFYLYVHPNVFHKPEIMQDTEVSKPESKIKINTDTALVQHIVYTKCNEEEVLRTQAPDTMTSFTLAQMQKVYPGWTINKFDTAEVDMTLKVDSYCREHANNMFLGIKDGHVAVFYGKPGPKAIVKEVTAIPINHLMEQDLVELRQGLVVGSKEELLRTIEGLQSR